MPSSNKKRIAIIAIVSIVLVASSSVIVFIVLRNKSNSEQSFEPIDVYLPSNSTGSSSGKLALRIYLPKEGLTRYTDGAPVIVWGFGGGTAGGLGNPAPPINDSIVISFLYPGGVDNYADRQSDGVYDYRGENSIQALRDVILFAAGELVDEDGKLINQIVPINVLHNNIGLLGESFGGNIIVAVAAFHGETLTDYLKYIIQWETPVSSQITNLDFGRVLPSPGEMGTQLDLHNPRFLNYGKKTFHVNYTDLCYNATEEKYQVFHDGTGDGKYTTISTMVNPLVTSPDLNGDNNLTTDEDFPLNYCFFEEIEGKRYYSRNVTHALEDNNVFSGPWPTAIATPEEADEYWDIREAVRLYEQAVSKMPDLQAMLLAGVNDHVQAHPEKPHLRQAFDGWNDLGIWVRMNPSPKYIRNVHPSLAGRNDLPDNIPNVPPGNWSNHEAYCIPVDISKEIYQTAAFWEMADKIHESSLSKNSSHLATKLGPMATTIFTHKRMIADCQTFEPKIPELVVH